MLERAHSLAPSSAFQCQNSPWYSCVRVYPEKTIEHDPYQVEPSDLDGLEYGYIMVLFIEGSLVEKLLS